jgi:5-carboxymethyl-2-hydroxymuconate isomerase
MCFCSTRLMARAPEEHLFNLADSKSPDSFLHCYWSLPDGRKIVRVTIASLVLAMTTAPTKSTVSP